MMREGQEQGGPAPGPALAEEGWWSAEVDISRSPSPGVPPKRLKMTLDDIAHDLREATGPRERKESDNLDRLKRTPEALGYGNSAQSFKELLFLSSVNHSLPSSVRTAPARKVTYEEFIAYDVKSRRKKKMQTGCITCLIRGVPCDPSNPDCQLAMSDDWNLNYGQAVVVDEDGEVEHVPETSLTVFRPDVKWRRNWRERHSLNFFVNFSAPQMAGFFDSTFWQRMVIQTSYHEPAILHAITAIGALHECIMQRAFADEKRKARAIEFALNQCNSAINCLTTRQAAASGVDFDNQGQRAPNSRLALTTCVLFTCFEAMQGRCDSAVNHALQGRRLLQATGRPNVTSMTPAEEDDLEQMRPIVERLEVQATALLDKGRRPEVDTSDQTPPLPPIEYVFSLDHAHNTLHTALNSVMRFMQGFHPTAPRDHIAVTMAEKYLRYGPWFARWESAFTAYLVDRREHMSNMDLKRAMVLKANHLVGTMLASVDQSAGPVAYDAYEAEFRAIVDLAREVLASFSCPPLPTLTGGSSGTPYLSFSLWVTDPLWMAISRCRNPSIRQAAFTLLSQNPRQEGIWHAGPQLTNQKYMRRVEPAKSTDDDSSSNKRKHSGTARQANGVNGSQSNGTHSDNGASSSSTLGQSHDDNDGTPQSQSTLSSGGGGAVNGNGNSHTNGDGITSTSSNGSASASASASTSGTNTEIKNEWLDMRDRIEHNAAAHYRAPRAANEPIVDVDVLPPERYESVCTGRCSIPRLDEVGLG